MTPEKQYSLQDLENAFAAGKWAGRTETLWDFGRLHLHEFEETITEFDSYIASLSSSEQNPNECDATEDDS